MAEILCPSCTSDNVQKYSVLNSHGTSVINTKSRSTGVGLVAGRLAVGGGKTSTTGVEQTQIGRMTAPPVKQPLAKKVICVIAFGIIALSTFGNHWTVAIICTLIALGSLLLVFQSVKFNREQWPGLYHHWTRKYLCNKCGTTFEVSDDTFVQATTAPVAD